MQIDGIHHISTMTGDGRAATEFATGVLGLRLAAKTVNQDAPDMYHLFFTDEDAQPGADLTMFEVRGLPRGRDGAGMVHRIGYRVADVDALAFWEQRLTRYGLPNRRVGDALWFEDPEGLGFELVVDDSPDEPLSAVHPRIPAEVALRGFAGVRLYSRTPGGTATALEGPLGARRVDDPATVDRTGGAATGRAPLSAHELRSDRRGAHVLVDAAPEQRPLQGAGTVHHVAFGIREADYEAWDPHVRAAGLHTSGLVDRFYFHSIYFREPGGVLYELATDEPGFEARNPREEWGRKIILPPWLEPRRAEVEAGLQPIPDPREDWDPEELAATR
jgi:glyoxalase family protein